MDKKELVERHIGEHTDPASARLRDGGASVWAIIGYYHAVNEDARRTAEDYGVPREAVDAALAYYADHKRAIDGRLALNAA